MNEIFEYETRIYYDNTDAGGVVYHSKYLDICERARTEYLRNIGIIQSKLLEEKGIGFVVIRAILEYKKPAKLDDFLKITTKVLEHKGIILKIEQNIFLISRKDVRINDELLFNIKLEIATVNRIGKPTRLPKEISDLF